MQLENVFEKENGIFFPPPFPLGLLGPIPRASFLSSWAEAQPATPSLSLPLSYLLTGGATLSAPSSPTAPPCSLSVTSRPIPPAPTTSSFPPAPRFLSRSARAPILFPFPLPSPQPSSSARSNRSEGRRRDAAILRAKFVRAKPFSPFPSHG